MTHVLEIQIKRRWPPPESQGQSRLPSGHPSPGRLLYEGSPLMNHGLVSNVPPLSEAFFVVKGSLGVIIWTSSPPPRAASAYSALLKPHPQPWESSFSGPPPPRHLHQRRWMEKLIALRLTLSYFGRRHLAVPGIKTFLWSSHADQHRIISDSFYILNIAWNLNKGEAWQ